MLRNRDSSARGFTLIELMIVIAIIGIGAHLLYGQSFYLSSFRKVDQQGLNVSSVVKAASLLDMLSVKGRLVSSSRITNGMEYRFSTSDKGDWQIRCMADREVEIKGSGVKCRIQGKMMEKRLRNLVLLTLVPDSSMSSYPGRIKGFSAAFSTGGSQFFSHEQGGRI